MDGLQHFKHGSSTKLCTEIFIIAVMLLVAMENSFHFGLLN